MYVSEQLDDYRTVVKYCRQQSEFDPHKIVLWGTSFSGPYSVIVPPDLGMSVLI